MPTGGWYCRQSRVHQVTVSQTRPLQLSFGFLAYVFGPKTSWESHIGLACILLLPGFRCVTVCQQLSLSGPPKFQSVLETVETAGLNDRQAGMKG